MGILNTAGRFIAKYGQAATLKRQGESDLAVKVKRVVTLRELEDTGNTAAQLHNFVKAGTAELAASDWTVKAPARKDQLSLDGRVRTILSVRPVLYGNTVGLYVLELAG
jgi:hypothetical protein